MCEDYRLSHRAPTGADDVAAPLWNVEDMMPDYYARPGLYRYSHGLADWEAERAIMAARGNPDCVVTVYRAVPGSVNTIHTGDWVTVSQHYARLHAYGMEGWHILTARVAASQLWTEGYPTEWGYSGPDIEVSG